MKNKIIVYSTLAIAIVSGGLLFASRASAQQPQSVLQRQDRFGHRERHPFLYKSLRALEHAHALLAKGAHDFNGHRAKAEALTEEAIEQDRAAIAIDRK